MGQQRFHDYVLPSSSLLARLETLDCVRQKIIYSRRLERLWSFIEESYFDPDIRLNDAAKHSGVSQDHLNLMSIWALPSQNIAPMLKSGAATVVGSIKVLRILKVVMIGELALAVILLVVAGLMVRSFWALRYHDLGFEAERF